MLMRQDAKSLDLGRAIYHKLHASADCHDLLKEARDWAVRFSQQRPEDIWLAEWVNISTLPFPQKRDVMTCMICYFLLSSTPLTCVAVLRFLMC